MTGPEGPASLSKCSGVARNRAKLKIIAEGWDMFHVKHIALDLIYTSDILLVLEQVPPQGSPPLKKSRKLDCDKPKKPLTAPHRKSMIRTDFKSKENSMNAKPDFFSDDLSDLLGNGPVAPKARELPQDEGFARIRETVPDFTETCPACKGTGKFTSWAGRTVGQCFKCKGRGSKSFKTSPEKRSAATQGYANKKDANWASFAERNPEVSTWIIAKSSSFEFAAAMKSAVMTYGDLTEKQLATSQRLAQKDADYAANKLAAKSAPVVAPQGYPNLAATFDALLAKGVRKAQMTAGDVNLSLASLAGKNPGAIYVKDAGNYVGKIVKGQFFGRAASADLLARLAVIEQDPKAAVMLHAKMTAERIAAAKANGQTLSLPCGCCGLTLSDPVSVERGIGPVCADKWGF